MLATLDQSRDQVPLSRWRGSVRRSGSLSLPHSNNRGIEL
jgi:hypothetical protein